MNRMIITKEESFDNLYENTLSLMIYLRYFFQKGIQLRK